MIRQHRRYLPASCRMLCLALWAVAAVPARTAPANGTTAFSSPASGGFSNLTNQPSPQTQNYLGYKFAAVSSNLVSITHASGRVNLITGVSTPASNPVYFALGSDNGDEFKAVGWSLRATNSLWTGTITATGYRDGTAVSGATSTFNIAAAATDYTWNVSGTGFDNVDEVRFSGPTSGTGALSFNSITVNPAVAPIELPTVTLPASSAITGTAAVLGGTVTADGGGTITERGIVYSITSVNGSPQVSGSGVTKVTASGTTGAFTVSATGLAPGTGYSFAAYATNSAGTAYTTPASTYVTLSDDASLVALASSAGALVPVFASATASYAAEVLRPSDTVTLVATVAEPHATLAMRANGGAYAPAASGLPGGLLALDLGANTLDVRVTAQDGITQRTYSIAMRRLTYLEAWRRAHYGITANAGNAADTAAPQFDGMPNLLKFAMAMNPEVTGVPPVVFVKNGPSLEFNYPRSIEAAVECSFIVEWSDTLLNNDWVATGVSEQVLSATSSTQQVRASLPDGGGPRRFVRLRVTNP